MKKKKAKSITSALWVILMVLTTHKMVTKAKVMNRCWIGPLTIVDANAILRSIRYKLVLQFLHLAHLYKQAFGKVIPCSSCSPGIVIWSSWVWYFWSPNRTKTSTCLRQTRRVEEATFPTSSPLRITEKEIKEFWGVTDVHFQVHKQQMVIMFSSSLSSTDLRKESSFLPPSCISQLP